MHPTLLYTVQLIFGIVSGSFVTYLILKQKGLWFNNNNQNKTQPNHVSEESISTIKVKKVKPQDDSVPFTTTGYTYNNVGDVLPEKRKNSSLSQGYKQQNPKYDSNTFQPKPMSTLQMNKQEIEKMKKLMGLISK